jgi:hypothetical protein
MLTNNAVTAVTVLSRRPVPMAEGHEKVHVIIHGDFSSYLPRLLEKLKGAEGRVWALGVSSNEVDSACAPSISHAVLYEKILILVL